MINLAEPPNDVSTTRSAVFLPIVQTEPATAIFLRLALRDKRQARVQVKVCEALSRAAHQRAFGLANGAPWSHVDGDGMTPNEYARRAGCRLPWNYAAKGNNIELLASGSPDAQAIFDALAASQTHSIALFAREHDESVNPFFVQQRSVGVALCEGGEMGWYWCLMFAVCEE